MERPAMFSASATGMDLMLISPMKSSIGCVGEVVAVPTADKTNDQGDYSSRIVMRQELMASLKRGNAGSVTSANSNGRGSKRLL